VDLRPECLFLWREVERRTGQAGAFGEKVGTLMQMAWERRGQGDAGVDVVSVRGMCVRRSVCCEDTWVRHVQI
jgi:hypothetical protein